MTNMYELRAKHFADETSGRIYWKAYYPSIDIGTLGCGLTIEDAAAQASSNLATYLACIGETPEEPYKKARKKTELKCDGSLLYTSYGDGSKNDAVLMTNEYAETKDKVYDISKDGVNPLDLDGFELFDYFDDIFGAVYSIIFIAKDGVTIKALQRMPDRQHPKFECVVNIKDCFIVQEERLIDEL